MSCSSKRKEANTMKSYYKTEEYKLNEYFKTYFEGKIWSEIESDESLYDRWDFYSDWYKDVYGVRPHGLIPMSR